MNNNEEQNTAFPELHVRLGVFEFSTKTGDDEYNWLTISNAANNWKVSYRNDNYMHPLVRFMMEEEKDGVSLNEYFEAWARLCYITSNMLPDLQTLDELQGVLARAYQRIEAEAGKTDSPNDDRILEEEKDKRDIQDEIKEQEGQ